MSSSGGLAATARRLNGQIRFPVVIVEGHKWSWPCGSYLPKCVIIAAYAILQTTHICYISYTSYTSNRFLLKISLRFIMSFKSTNKTIVGLMCKRYKFNEIV
jgi:hypothetical protein